MLYINKLTTDPQQQILLTGINGLSISMTLRFMPRTQRWIMGLDTGSFSLEGVAVVTAPNILRQWRNQIDFGIACITGSGLDPFTVSDFATQASNLYLLDADDILEVEGTFFS